MPSPRRPIAQRAAAYAAAAAFSLGVLLAGGRGTARAAIHATPLPELVRRALASPGTRWVQAESAQVAVYAIAGSPAAADLAAARAEAEAARAANLKLLGDRRLARQLHVVFVNDREQMRAFTGGTPGGTAEPEQFAAAVVGNAEVRPPLRHELMHVMAVDRWGQPASPWIREGLATWAAGRCAGRDLHAIAASIGADGRLVPLEELARTFDVRGERGAVMYVQSGSVMKYVADTYGTERLRAFYRSGLAGAPQSLGREPAALEREWRATVARHASKERWTRIHADVARHGCE